VPRHPEEHATLVRLANAGRRHVPSLPPGDGAPRRTRRLEVFGVGPDWIQVTWSALGPGTVEVRCAGEQTTLHADGGPGAHLIEGLASGREVRIDIAGEGVAEGRLTLDARTLTAPPGEELLRVATVSDVHIGSHSTGYFHTIVEIPEPEVTHTVRCLRAALDELTGWGAEHLVVKGDLVHRSEQANWDVVGRELEGFGIPIDVIPGNHERSKAGDVPAEDAIAELGHPLVAGVRWVDHSGVRILMADTTRPRTDIGDLGAVHDDLVAAATGTEGPVFLALHHQPMRFRFPVYLPPGIPGPQARRLFADLGRANARLIASSGHTHRHRRHRIQGVTATEVGSTKDFPGTWAGYHVHEGGVVQVVRRIAEPSCIRWTDHTRRAALGVWSRWAPGRLGDRCFTVEW
jgi:Icc protein